MRETAAALLLVVGSALAWWSGLAPLGSGSDLLEWQAVTATVLVVLAAALLLAPARRRHRRLAVAAVFPALPLLAYALERWRYHCSSLDGWEVSSAIAPSLLGFAFGHCAEWEALARQRALVAMVVAGACVVLGLVLLGVARLSSRKSRGADTE